MKKLKKGDVVKFKKRDFEFIKETFEQINAISMAIEDLASSKRKYAVKVWKYISEISPETKEMQLKYSYKSNDVLVVGYDNDNI